MGAEKDNYQVVIALVFLLWEINIRSFLFYVQLDVNVQMKYLDVLIKKQSGSP